MLASIVKNIVKLLYKRTFVFYLFVFLMLHSVINFDQTQKKLDLVALSRLRPHSIYILQLNSESISTVDQKKIREYERYFKKVQEVVPHRADTDGMLGVCYFYLNDLNNAIAYLEKAASQHSVFFWYRYNLGILYYQNQEFQKATEQFLAAYGASSELAIKYIYDSIVYRALINESQITDPKEFALRIKDKRRIINLFLADSYLHLGEYKKSLYFSMQALNSDQSHREIALYLAGKASFQLGQSKEAVIYLKQALSENSNIIEAYDALIEIFKKEGQESLVNQLSVIRNRFGSEVKSPFEIFRNQSPKIF